MSRGSFKDGRAECARVRPHVSALARAAGVPEDTLDVTTRDGWVFTRSGRFVSQPSRDPWNDVASHDAAYYPLPAEYEREAATALLDRMESSLGAMQAVRRAFRTPGAGGTPAVLRASPAAGEARGPTPAQPGDVPAPGGGGSEDVLRPLDGAVAHHGEKTRDSPEKGTSC